jgi:hydroxypyruvate reductase
MKGDYPVERLRSMATGIFLAAIRSVNAYEAVKSCVGIEGDHLSVMTPNGEKGDFELSKFKRVFVIGGGKATASMAHAAEEILGNRIERGIINVKYGHTADLGVIKINEVGHPIPDEAGLGGAQEIVSLLVDTDKDDLVMALISGGGSALLPMPSETISLEEKQQVTRLLLSCGADIREINAVRKHISQIKGGQLAKLSYPSTMISLVLSDVVGDGLDSIASGPTVPDTSTFADVLAVIEKYGLLVEIPRSVREHIAKGIGGEIEETPKAGDRIFHNVYNFIVGNNTVALRAAEKRARDLGLNTLILSSFIEGETREVARLHTAIAREILHSGNPVAPPACLISGGETTVIVKGEGLGGRNQEFCLAAALEIGELKDVVVLSAGTDGTDGPTDAAGAIADSTTVERARLLGLNASEFLDNNDSYHFFENLQDLLVTGPTNTNVMDVRLVLVGME